jgi:hypothetical protein
MAQKPEPGSNEPEPSRQDLVCLERTRTAVFNVLIAIGLFIALSGALLRYWTLALDPAASRRLHQELLVGLLVISVISYATRRILSQRRVHRQGASRESLFYWSHVLPALIAALAAPLGLIYGLWIDRSVQSVVPFWVVALALGSLALPRTHELDCSEQPTSGSRSVPS